jgi:hypothetical protein
MSLKNCCKNLKRACPVNFCVLCFCLFLVLTSLLIVSQVCFGCLAIAIVSQVCFGSAASEALSQKRDAPRGVLSGLYVSATGA